MAQYTIMLKTQQELRDFVKIMETCPFDVDLHCGHITIDAKSILGVMAAGLNKKMQLWANTDNRDEMKHAIVPFLCEY